jgi:hypothetical protein
MGQRRFRIVSIQMAAAQVKLDKIFAGQSLLHFRQPRDGVVRPEALHGQFGGKHGHAGANGTLSEMGAGYDGIKGRYGQLGVHGVDHQNL